jgi:hypothetical protein
MAICFRLGIVRRDNFQQFPLKFVIAEERDGQGARDIQHSGRQARRHQRH